MTMKNKPRLRLKGKRWAFFNEKSAPSYFCRRPLSTTFN